MRYEIYLLMPLAGIMLLGGILHFLYLNRIKSKVSRTMNNKIGMDSVKRVLQAPQGSNFNTFVLFTWSLFFVAVIFLYLLTPTISHEWNYFMIPSVASQELGLTIFGIMAILITGTVAFNIPKIYRYYVISRPLKSAIIYLAPLLLVVSLLVSTYLGTIYPNENSSIWYLGYLALIASQILLLLPVAFGFMGELR